MVSSVVNSLFQGLTFTNNWAIRGGGMFLKCSSPNRCYFNFKGTNSFRDNYANNSGGAIYWSEEQPTLIPNSWFNFSNNFANVYADNIGCYS